MSFYSKSKDEVLKQLKSSQDGLSSEEAQKRLEQNGENKLAEGKKTSLFMRLLAQFKDIMVIVLMVAATISLVIALVEGQSEELIDAFIIYAIVLLNAILGTMQEMKAENALESLKKMSQPFAKVIRDGQMCKVKTTEIVVGDVVVLEAGDVVPADMYLIESASLKCEEASLTGESKPAEKEAAIKLKEKTPLGDRVNMCFSSSTVVYGRGVGVVTAVANDTEMGKIANMLNETKADKTPLEISLDKLGKVLTVVVLAIAVVLFVVNVCFDSSKILEAFLTAVAVAVAAIPESLMVVVTVILSLGVTKLAKKNVIIRKLHAVETLGCCEVICSDKTGTITQNKMTVMDIYYNGKIIDVNDVVINNNEATELVKCMTLCNDSQKQGDNYIGDPTETALIAFAESKKFVKSKLDKEYKRVGEIPFDSDRKLMSTANLVGDSVCVYTKGAIDELLKRCDNILVDGEVKKITKKHKDDIMEASKALGSRALRVLGYAKSEGPKYTKGDHFTDKEIKEEHLTFIGLTGMIDPPRKEVFAAIEKCKKAGMRAVMITGDHKDTACAIAKELKMIKSEKEVIEGAYLDKFTDEELVKEINKFRVFTRVSPEHKVRIVKALKANGKVVAMTGDGVNDAPSIKNANIGIGMGITGTEVTKEVADMVLTDDNFATIVVAVEEGRKIFGNIKKTIQFLLSSNAAEVLAIFIATFLFPGATFLIPVQILFVNLITDTLPAIALGVEPAEKSVMNQLPRKQDESIIGGRTGINILFGGFIQTAIVISAYIIAHNLWSPEVAPTAAFIALNFVQLFHMFNAQTQGSIFNKNPFRNPMIWVAFGFGVGVVALLGFVPFLSVAFKIASLSITQWLIVIALAFAIIPLSECLKLVYYFVDKFRAKKIIEEEVAEVATETIAKKIVVVENSKKVEELKEETPKSPTKKSAQKISAKTTAKKETSKNMATKAKKINRQK